MFSADDDDDFSVPNAGSSKLASLFDADGTRGDNQSLMYNAPKQPKKSKPAGTAGAKPSQPQMNVLHAIAVHTFKYDGSKHVSEGKLGLAIIGNHESLAYKLLLYKGQKQHVTCATISVAFAFVIQANNYATFYDDSHQSWSVNFDTAQAIAEFTKQVCLAKANTAKVASMKTIIVQDVALGEGETLDAGDLVEIKYTGWFFTNNAIGTMFDSNASSTKALRFRIGKGKCVKGLEEGTIGMKKNGRRFIVLPPCCGYANVEKAEALLKTSVLIYDVEAIKCKFGKDSASTHSSTPDHVDVEPERKTDSPLRSHSSSLTEDSSVKARCASLSEQLTQSPNKKKATIISRIVKMGQPMLPLQGAIVAQLSSESETEEETAKTSVMIEPVAICGDATNKPIPKPRPQQASSMPSSNIQHVSTPDAQPATIAQSMNVFPSTQVLPHSLPLATNTFAMVPHSSFSQAVPSPIFMGGGGGDGHLSLLLTENRTQNTELRMHIAKLSEKLEVLHAKVDSKTAESTSVAPNMESSVLSQNVHRICQENENLRKEVKDKNSKVEAQNEKICDLLQKNQRYIEQSTSLLEQRNTSMHTNATQLQSKLDAFEREKQALLSELEGARGQLSGMQARSRDSEDDVKRMASEKQDAVDNCEKLKELVARFEEQKLEWENEKLELLDRVAEGKKSTTVAETVDVVRKEYEEQIETLNRQVQQLKSKPGTTDTSSPNLVNEVKKIMNAVFKHLQSEFKNDENYTGAHINKTLKSKIIDITLQLTQKYAQQLQDLTDGANVAVETVDDDRKYAMQEKSEIESEKVLPVSETNRVDCNEQDERKLDQSAEDHQVVKGNTEDDAKRCELPGDHVSDTEDYEPWKPQPPPPPAFIEEPDDEDDWLK